MPLARESRRKSAGLRTYTVVGLSAALIMLVSPIRLQRRDRAPPHRARPFARRLPDRVGRRLYRRGVIFVRKDSVRRLTTAAGATRSRLGRKRIEVQSGRQFGRGEGEEEPELAPVGAPCKGVVTLTPEIGGVRLIPKLTARLSETPEVASGETGAESLAFE